LARTLIVSGRAGWRGRLSPIKASNGGSVDLGEPATLDIATRAAQ
jgi:hypothetical protein